MQRFVAVNEGVNVTYAAVVAKISLTRHRRLSDFRSVIVANNPLKTIIYWHGKILRLDVPAVGRGAQFLITNDCATSQRVCCSVDSVLIFAGRFQKRSK
jgi:hypothetical protein